jgi:hypothetical protein
MRSLQEDHQRRTDTASRHEGAISLDESQLLYEVAAPASWRCVVAIGCYPGPIQRLRCLSARQAVAVSQLATEPHKEFLGVLGGKFGSPTEPSPSRTTLTPIRPMPPSLVGRSTFPRQPSPPVGPGQSYSCGLAAITDMKPSAVTTGHGGCSYKRAGCPVPRLMRSQLWTFD